jgi:hypothetical protein
MSNITREANVDPATQLEPGALVMRVGNELIPVDTSEAGLHLYAPVEVVWTDGTKRQDIMRTLLDGSEVLELTTIAFDCMAEVDVSLFTDTPAEGDYMVRSATAGQIEPMTLTELTADSDRDQECVVGKVISSGDSTGKWVVRFTLG